MRTLHLKLNGDDVEIAAPDHWTLLEVLRYRAGLTGTKQGCDKGDCGACTLHLDGRAVLSCLTLAAEADGRSVTTIEGLVGPDGPDVVQDCFDAAGALQCGFCQPGMMMAARQLVTENPAATRDDVRAALASNLCRCTGYTKIYEAVENACRRERDRLATPRPDGEGADPAADDGTPSPSASPVGEPVTGARARRDGAAHAGRAGEATGDRPRGSTTPSPEATR